MSTRSTRMTIRPAGARSLFACGLAGLILAALASCAPMRPDTVQDISAWGIGWQFKAVQNRIGPAIPPVLVFLRDRYPGAAIEPVEPPVGLAADFRAIVFRLDGATRDALDRRLIGVFTVEGLPCAAAGFAVRDGTRAVAAILALDISVRRQAPSTWRLCHEDDLAESGQSPLKALILSQVNRVLSSP